MGGESKNRCGKKANVVRRIKWYDPDDCKCDCDCNGNGDGDGNGNGNGGIEGQNNVDEFNSSIYTETYNTGYDFLFVIGTSEGTNISRNSYQYTVKNPGLYNISLNVVYATGGQYIANKPIGGSNYIDILELVRFENGYTLTKIENIEGKLSIDRKSMVFSNVPLENKVYVFKFIESQQYYVSLSSYKLTFDRYDIIDKRTIKNDNPKKYSMPNNSADNTPVPPVPFDDGLVVNNDYIFKKSNGIFGTRSGYKFFNIYLTLYYHNYSRKITDLKYLYLTILTYYEQEIPDSERIGSIIDNKQNIIIWKEVPFPDLYNWGIRFKFDSKAFPKPFGNNVYDSITFSYNFTFERVTPQ